VFTSEASCKINVDRRPNTWIGAATFTRAAGAGYFFHAKLNSRREDKFTISTISIIDQFKNTGNHCIVAVDVGHALEATATQSLMGLSDWPAKTAEE